ncbi:hypothetical protein [Salinimonas lutimaris]|uniref:hypothetical protein n=1 Tax=Salinimonas lutimaris TaxID=914153 RepID=UPI0010BFF090|nr:hypothetical protein [Salinimonas lutimaris]
MKKIILPLAFLIAGLAAPASAASAQSVAAQLRHCGQIDADDKRLACYDQLTATMRQTPAPAKQSAPLVSDTARQVAKVSPPATTQPAPNRQTPAEFGLQKNQQDQLDEISAGISKVEKDKRGKFTLTLDNGMVWKQTNSAFFRPRVGDTATIERGAMGVFYLGVEDSNRRIKVKRQQ